MSRLLNCLVMILMAFSLLNCRSETDDVIGPKLNLPDSEDYFPLHVTNYWELAHLPRRSIKTLETFDDVPYYGMVSNGDTTYYRKTSDGKVYHRKKTTEEILEFDLSADEGQTWTYKESEYDETWYVTLLSKNDTIHVGDYSFSNCYRFYFDIPEMADDEKSVWLAPGIGFIEEYYPGGTADRKVLKKVRIDGVEIEL